MNLRKKISSVLLSLILTCNSAAFTESNAAENIINSVSLSSDLQARPSFSSFEDAVSYVREQLKQRNPDISFVLYNDIPQSDSPIDDIVRSALSETGKSTEGDYLYLSIRSYSCRYSTNSSKTRLTVTSFTPVYNTTYEQEQTLTEYIENLKRSLRLDGMSDYQKAESIYNYIAENVHYANSASDDTYSAYSALVNGTAVCQGYSQLLYRLFLEEGIPCRFVGGLGNGGNHAWNIAKIDGIYYQLDVTWDSTLRKGNKVYFLRGTKDFDELSPQNSHILGADTTNSENIHTDYSSAEFLAEYPISDYAYGSAVKYSKGDINSDGSVNSVDASLAMAIYTQMSSESQLSFSNAQISAGDVNSDGSTNSIDASVIMAYYSSLSTGNNSEITEFIINYSK